MLLADQLYVRRPDLATLFVTSARFTMSPEHITAHPKEGALMSLQPGVTGRAAYRFSSTRTLTES